MGRNLASVPNFEAYERLEGELFNLCLCNAGIGGTPIYSFNESLDLLITSRTNDLYTSIWFVLY